MTKKEREERIEQLRQHPAFRELVDILRGQEQDRVDAFLDECEESITEEEDNERTGGTDR